MELSISGTLPPPRCGHSVTMIEKRLLIYGGRGNFDCLTTWLLAPSQFCSKIVVLYRRIPSKNKILVFLLSNTACCASSVFLFNVDTAVIELNIFVLPLLFSPSVQAWMFYFSNQFPVDQLVGKSNINKHGYQYMFYFCISSSFQVVGVQSWVIYGL